MCAIKKCVVIFFISMLSLGGYAETKRVVVIPLGAEQPCTSQASSSPACTSFSIPVGWETSICTPDHTGSHIASIGISTPYSAVPSKTLLPKFERQNGSYVWTEINTYLPVVADVEPPILFIRFGDSGFSRPTFWMFNYTSIGGVISGGMSGRPFGTIGDTAHFARPQPQTCDELKLFLNSARITDWTSYSDPDTLWDVVPTFVNNGTTLTLKELVFSTQ